MKSENKKQKETVIQNNLKIKLMAVGITVISMFALTGCHGQTAAVLPQNINSLVFANETNLKPVPALLTKKITLSEGEQISPSYLNHESIELSALRTNLVSQYSNASILSLELAKESWKDTYDGQGLPLLKISF